MPSRGAAELARVRVPVPPETPAEGGGAITVPRVAPEPLRTPRGLLPVEPLFTDGGGGTTLGVNEDARELPPCVLAELTEGGGGTTSLDPKSFPTMLLQVPLACCGGATTALEGSRVPPLGRRRMSCEMLVEGGGAITEGAGMVSLDWPVEARSGAETGGGTTAPVDCIGAREYSRPAALGAGGMTLADSVAVERRPLAETAAAGATTDASSEGV